MLLLELSKLLSSGVPDEVGASCLKEPMGGQYRGRCPKVSQGPRDELIMKWDFVGDLRY